MTAPSVVKAVVLLAMAALLAAAVAFRFEADAARLKVSRLETQLAEQRGAGEKALREQTARYRAIEQAARFAAEGVSRDQEERLALSARGAAASALALGGLRDEILRRDAARLPQPADAAGVAALAGEARAARELFGACAEEYQRLAGEAEGVRIQAAGLQVFDAATRAAGGP